MSSFVPHTEEEISSMLSFLGLESLDDLYTAIPAALRLGRPLGLPAGLSEVEVIEKMDMIASRNRSASREMICFAGGGAYDHDLYSAPRALGGRSEFVTAYTPYQPEVAQGVLQALFEYQTMVSRLSGLPISNASLYDGASALVEAVNLAVARTRRSRVVLSEAVNPHWRETVSTFAMGPGHEVEVAPVDASGSTVWPDDAQGVACYVVAYPNYLGLIEDVAAVKRRAVEAGALLVVAYDPVAMSLLKSPGELGADVAVAEGQSLGIPLSFGGPYLGLFSTTMELVRLLPGRLVGETVDTRGNTAYVTTLRAREQDIRREKASSNVCTNQTLMAVWAAIHLSWLGRQGFAELGRRCLSGRYYLSSLMEQRGIGEVRLGSGSVREFPVSLQRPASEVVEEMLGRGFLAGVALEGRRSIGAFEGSLLVAVTEKRTKAEMDRYVDELAEVLK